MDTHEVKPIWTSSTFLVYTGGLTVLGGGAAALAYLSSHYGKGAEVGWALLVLVILYSIAHALRLAGVRESEGRDCFFSTLRNRRRVCRLRIGVGGGVLSLRSVKREI